MNKEEFKKLCSEGFIFLDGATGSNLIKKGMPSGVCPEKWIIDNPDAIIELQTEYYNAGSDIVLAPTFTANRIKLAEYGLSDNIREINHKLVSLTKEASGGKGYVAADISMTGKQLKPMGDLDFEELIDVYKEQISYICEEGVDLIIIETMMSLQETRAALIAAKETCDLPVLCSLTFENDGRTLYGSDPKTCAIVLESLGASAVGANCSAGPDKMAEIIKQMAEVVSIPVIAKPNAGMPSLDKDGNTVYSMSDEEFSSYGKLLVESGASILGGCCGTAPSYIKALKEKVMSLDLPKKKDNSGIRFLTSERKTVSFGLNDPFIVVGERINPTGKKKLQEQLREDCMDMVMQFTEEQEDCGASILDINVGMGGIDEKSMMIKVLDLVSNNTSLPLSVDTSPVDVLEAALRRYPGRALVNSVSAEDNVMMPKLRIAQKYGAMIIVLPLSDEGLPKNLDEKIKNINKVLDAAYDMGFKKEDIVIDGLVSTIGANKKAALEVLETIRYAKENGLATTCGLSNISFGLPERSFVNTAFLTMAINAGLTMAIMNPSQELLMNAAFATDLLNNKDGADLRYIERMNDRNYSINVSTENKKVQDPDPKASDVLFNDVLKGKNNVIVDHTKEAVNNGKDPQAILNESLLPAIEKVGDLFNEGKYFLPQLISSAETMKSSIEYLEPLMLKKDESKNAPLIVMATVKGDIHDIGKNLVTLMLKNHGFRVMDLGKDVEKELIIDTAVKNNADIIGLSALMTTTMSEMKNVVNYAKECGCKSKIMVGGAVITPEYADEIGADAYSKDAADAVLVAKSLVK